MTPAGTTAIAIWVRAWLSGVAGSDDLLDALARASPDGPQVVSLTGSAPQPLPGLFRVLRAVAGPRVWLALPRPGHPGAWPRDLAGPAGPAVLVSVGDSTEGGVLRLGAAGWLWDTTGHLPVRWLEAQSLTARGGARALTDTATEAATRLESLGLQRAATQPAPQVWAQAVRRLPVLSEPAALALLVRLAELHDVLDLAAREAGAAVTAGEARARSTEVGSVLGAVEDIMCGVIGGMNLADGNVA